MRIPLIAQPADDDPHNERVAILVDSRNGKEYARIEAAKTRRTEEFREVIDRINFLLGAL